MKLFLYMLPWVFVWVTLIMVAWKPTYEDGQRDALRGHYEYELVIQPNGDVKTIELPTPSTQPIILK